MRRLSTIPLLLALAITLVACGGTQAPQDGTNAVGDDGRITISSATGDPLPPSASATP